MGKVDRLIGDYRVGDLVEIPDASIEEEDWDVGFIIVERVSDDTLIVKSVKGRRFTVNRNVIIKHFPKGEEEGEWEGL